MTLPRVAVLLLNWNGWRDTIECLESLMRLDYEPFHVVICDQASTDGSADRIREWANGTFTPELTPNPVLAHLVTPPVRKPIALVEYTRAQAEADHPPALESRLVLIQTGANLGYGGGNNVGLHYLMGQPALDYVWVLNNDIVVAPDSLTALVRVAEANPRLGMVGGQLLDYTETNRLQTAGGGKFSPWRGYPTPLETVVERRASDGSVSADLDWVTGGNMLVPVDALRKVGDIDAEYFVYMEDIDHSIRFERAGYQFGYAADSRVWHKGGGTVGYYSLRHDYYTVRNALMVSQRYNRRWMPFVFGYTVYRCVLPKLLRGQWDRIRAVARGYSDFRRGVTGKANL